MCPGFPAINTGVYGDSRDQAALSASRAIAEHFDPGQAVELVLLVFFSAADADVFLDASPLSNPIGQISS